VRGGEREERGGGKRCGVIVCRKGRDEEEEGDGVMGKRRERGKENGKID